MNTIKNTLVENLTTQGQEKLSINGIKDKYIRENMKKLMDFFGSCPPCIPTVVC